jgi:hypothetical protein
MPITEEQIAKHRAAKAGIEMHVISNSDTGIEVLVRVPDEGAWKRFRAMGSDDAQRPMALRQLVLDCLLEPTPAEFLGILAHRPGLSETFGADLVEIAGVSRANTRRKV